MRLSPHATPERLHGAALQKVESEPPPILFTNAINVGEGLQLPFEMDYGLATVSDRSFGARQSGIFYCEGLLDFLPTVQELAMHLHIFCEIRSTNFTIEKGVHAQRWCGVSLLLLKCHNQ